MATDIKRYNGYTSLSPIDETKTMWINRNTRTLYIDANQNIALTNNQFERVKMKLIDIDISKSVNHDLINKMISIVQTFLPEPLIKKARLKVWIDGVKGLALPEIYWESMRQGSCEDRQLNKLRFIHAVK